MKKIIISLLSLLFLAGTAYTQEKDVVGSWLGTLDLGSVSLRIIFNISGDKTDYKVTMDSPDQGAKGIPIGPVEVKGDSLIIKAASLRGEYKGKFESLTTIKGMWTQAGNSLALNLEKQAEEFKLNRPQEPKEPYPYKSEDVKFPNQNAGFDLAGTITIPSEGQNLPAVILVSGSGPQNRDEEIFGHKPFKVLADYLSRHGIAVLRYDDRGVAGSGGSIIGATTADLAGDARSAVEYLQTLDRINKSAIGIIGHSEGGLIAQLVAAKHNDIAFIVSLAGQGTSGRQVLLDQVDQINRLSDIPEEENLRNLKINNAIYDLLEEIEDPEKGFEAIVEKVDEIANTPGRPETSIEDIRESMKAQLGPASYLWMRYFVLSDPAKLLPEITCPVLALNGEKDCQVLYKQNLEGIKKGLSASKDVTTLSFPDLNHLFQHCTTGLINEYGQIEETMSPEVLDVIASWINKRF